MSIANLKIELTKYLLEAKSEALLKQIKALIKSHEDDFWDDLSVEAKNSILKGRKQIEQGDYKSHKTVMKKYQKWLTK